MQVSQWLSIPYAPTWWMAGCVFATVLGLYLAGLAAVMAALAGDPDGRAKWLRRCGAAAAATVVSVLFGPLLIASLATVAAAWPAKHLLTDPTLFALEEPR